MKPIGIKMPSEEIEKKEEVVTRSVEPKTETKPTTLEDIMKDPGMSKSVIDYVNSEKSNAVNKWRDENLNLAIEKEIDARSKKSPEQIKFDEYEKKLEEMDRKLKTKERSELISTNKNIVLKALTEKNLPSDLVDFIVSDEQEITNKNIEVMTTIFENFKGNLTANAVKNNNVSVPNNDSGSGSSTVQEPSDNATKAEWNTYWAKVRQK